MGGSDDVTGISLPKELTLGVTDLLGFPNGKDQAREGAKRGSPGAERGSGCLSACPSTAPQGHSPLTLQSTQEHPVDQEGCWRLHGWPGNQRLLA